jgi:diadenosine tetraphosphatase ApaH/serine/threonine PP2A family protein phosphatase
MGTPAVSTRARIGRVVQINRFVVAFLGTNSFIVPLIIIPISRMLIAILSDIHGNLPALEEVLKKAEDLKADVLYCLGDTVGYGPFPNECVSLVREHCSVILKGNHDSGLIGETPLEDFNHYGRDAIVWSKSVVTAEHQEFLHTLPSLMQHNGVTLAHSSPHKPDAWTYILTMRSAQDNFAAFSSTICFIGHTHVPVVIGEDGTVNKYKPGTRCIINVGSVGQPRDGNPRAAFGIYDTETFEYNLIRVPYEIQRTARAVRDLGLPEFLAQRLFQGA